MLLHLFLCSFAAQVLRESGGTLIPVLAVVLSGQHVFMTSWWRIRLQNCIFPLPYTLQLQTYSQQEKVTAKCHLISFFTLSTRWCKGQCQVQENNETSLFLCVARESTASRKTVGMDFEDIFKNWWETKSSLSCDMWADNFLPVSHPSKWHCFYNTFVPGSLKHWLVTQISYKND